MAEHTKKQDVTEQTIEQGDGYMSIRIKTVRGDGVRDLDEVTAEFMHTDMEEFKAEVSSFQDFIEHVASRARDFNPHRDEEEN